MLFKLVDETCAHIDQLALTTCANELEQQLRSEAPEAIHQLIKESKRLGSQPSEKAAASVLALSAFGYIKGIPALARHMVEKIQDSSLPAARRCGIASVLSYLVNPKDLIGDDAPGGYGYLDDAIMLRAGLVAYMGTLPQPGSNVQTEARVVVFLVNLAPKNVRGTLQEAVTVMSHNVQTMSVLEPAIAETSLAHIIENPLDVPVPAAPLGFAPSVVNYKRMEWTGGAMFDGSNTTGPQGASRIDAEAFIQF